MLVSFCYLFSFFSFLSVIFLCILSCVGQLLLFSSQWKWVICMFFCFCFCSIGQLLLFVFMFMFLSVIFVYVLVSCYFLPSESAKFMSFFCFCFPSISFVKFLLGTCRSTLIIQLFIFLFSWLNGIEIFILPVFTLHRNSMKGITNF